jgi:hypothetical protein
MGKPHRGRRNIQIQFRGEDEGRKGELSRMKQLRMKEQYILWSMHGLKFATTRMKMKPCGDYELISGSYYKPKKSGLIIEITEIWAWTLNNLTIDKQKAIVAAEHFNSWKEFMDVIREINKGKKIDGETLFYTHFYKKVGIAMKKED